ncbi:MAG: bifunctional diaminohydroxyphosphoribosylaminopyrimidine deaminase/5-amino-6-(5-phosphoribosylamino)uracil reductase RibD [Planctomycetales bacterium]|nr:bifunctional diaminohydroxyphosphoribosylaminopyrimidine deaminase/5-amino-6-(5-phosphoribosylamino)uracil reductase RibD [Planctomycetales bacterium]
MPPSEKDQPFMLRALELAAQGEGRVEPNPMVGCVVAKDQQVVGQGFHTAFGQPHAEVEALRQAGPAARGATLYVTLEPCRHQGKTPPCTEAIIAAGIQRVVIATRDPFAQVQGGGTAELEAAGIEVGSGVLEEEARELNAPYFKRIETGRPWVLAKWAMTLDGKVATASGDSRWISCSKSRHIVHQLRGRVDAIVIGCHTADADDPLLTARPPGPRTAVRVVCDSQAQLSSESQLVKTARQTPVLVAVRHDAPPVETQRLTAAGCEVFACQGDSATVRLESLLDELGRRQMTNVLVEGGGRLLGTFFAIAAVDEVHVFVAPKIIAGGVAAVQGDGVDHLADAWQLENVHRTWIDEDTYISGRVIRSGP